MGVQRFIAGLPSNRSDPGPSSELLGYYHSSALRTGSLSLISIFASGLRREAWKLEMLSTLPHRDMRGARALDALCAFVSQRRQIQTMKQVLSAAEQEWHDCQM